VYVDTPGIHQRGDQPMNRYLNRTARTALADVDLVLFLVEALKWTQEDEAVLQALQRAKLPVVLVVNKVDRARDKNRLLPFIAEVSSRFPFTDVFPVSARQGDNVAELETKVLALLPENANFFPEDQLSDRSERFFAAEFIREQLIRRTAREIPYALTVEIEQFQEEEGLYRIAAIVWVEREGQKNIVIGRKGAALKEVATRAREEMERFFGTRVFLQIWVKVKKSWSSDESALIRLGYGEK
ncbi:MAG TPA: GTPase Era, partial [Sedimenticola thiotaurini]|nr:GTPase Era [Sedimenticola thiotaurini]